MSKITLNINATENRPPPPPIVTAAGKLIFPASLAQNLIRDIDPAELQKLALAARDVASNSYQILPQKFPVGAAVIMRDDPQRRIWSSASCETSILNAGQCAERALLSYVIGQGFRKIDTLAISTPARNEEALTHRSPCGHCRQKIYEFATDDTLILLDREDPEILGDILTMDQLLPFGYRYQPK